jgi:small subunit ribosomal protein S8e
MSIWHGERGRKKTGGEITIARKKRKRELGNQPLFTRIGKEKKLSYRTEGGGIKIKAFAVEFANVLDPNTNQSRKVKIIDVIDNPANPHFVRRKIITKGAIIKTEMGNARVTSRPTQDGVVNALILEKEENL